MFQTNPTTHQSGSALELFEAPSSLQPFIDERAAGQHERQSELAIDDTLAASFPASDPPAWNSGVARPIPAGPSSLVRPSRNRANGLRSGVAGDPRAADTPGVIDVSRPSGSDRSPLGALFSFAGAASLALFVPFAILLVGLPIALAIRGLLEVLLWLAPAIR